MSQEPIAVVLALQDDNGDYAVATTVRSAIDQLGPDDELLVYLLIDQVSPASIERMQRSWIDPRVTVSLIPMGERLRAFDYHSMRGAIARLMLGEVLPAEQKRVIHLDFDMLVMQNLRPLWETDLGGNVLGCVADPLAEVLPPRRGLQRAGRNIGWELKPEHVYFNAGMLLIDLERWREEKVGETTVGLLLDHPGLFRKIDQDVLNLALQSRVLYLSPMWNVMDPAAFLWEWGARYYRGLAPEQALMEPGIRHFSGSFKPWHLLVRHSEVERYYQSLDRTDWYGFRPVKRGALRRLFQQWIDFHWLTVRALWWPRGGELLRLWLRQATNPLWWGISLVYFVRLAALVIFYRPLRKWRDGMRQKARDKKRRA